MTTTHPIQRPSVFITAAVVVFTAAFFGKDILEQLSQRQNLSAQLGQSCILDKECQFSNGSVSLEQPVVRPLEPTAISVKLENVAETPDLFLQVEGIEMNMGTYHLSLERIGDNQYSGTLLLPVCTQDEMTWVGTVSSKDQHIEFPIAIRMEQ